MHVDNFIAILFVKFRSDLPISPRHHASAASNNNRSSETISSIIQTPIPSMILRDTSIREQSSLSVKDSQTSSSYFRGSLYNNNNNSSFNSYSSRERDCSSPFYGSSGSNNLPSSLAISNSSSTNSNGQLSLGSRENNSIIMRDNATTRVASNRFLSGGLDAQRIVKQSSEDCRRLLQQVG